MADQWYYAQQGQRQGPVDDEQLKQLVASGQLKPSDLVWKKGMAAWMAASAVEALIPKPSVPEPPPIPLQDFQLPPIPPKDFLPPPEPRSSAGNKVGKLIASLAKRGKAAAQLVAKQAVRTKLLNVNLPAAYQALGKQIHGTGNYRDEFPEVFKRLDDALAAIAALKTNSATAPKAEGFAAKAKAAANATTDMAHAQTLKLKLNHLFAELGKAAFEKHGNDSGPEEVVCPVLDCRARIGELDAEIKSLSQSEPGQMITPTRLAIGGLCIAAIVILLVIRSMFSGTGSSQVANEEHGRAHAMGTAEVATRAGPSKEELARVKAGDQLWDQDKKAEAIGQYMAIVNGSKDTLDKDTYARLLARTVDYLADGDDTSTARQLLKTATAHEDPSVDADWARPIVLPLASKKAKSLLAEVRTENEKERKRGEAQERADELREQREERKAEKELDGDTSRSNFYGQPRKDENELWISGEEAYRRQVEKDADTIRSQMRKGQWEK